MKSLLNSLPTFLPLVYIWAEKQECIILEEGTPLTESQVADARRAGVTYPEKIRVLRTEILPQPDDDELMFLALQIGLFNERFSGMTLGYGLCLRQDAWDDRQTLVHECVHVGQYEKRGGIRPFLSQYLRECIDPGYPFGRMEQEANLLAKDICKQTGALKTTN